jgi:hypothetical protein
VCIIGIRPSKWGKKTKAKSEARKKRARRRCCRWCRLESSKSYPPILVPLFYQSERVREHKKTGFTTRVPSLCQWHISASSHSCCLLALPSDKNLTRLAFITSPYIPPLHIYTHRPRARQPSPPLLLRLLLLHRYPPYSSLLLLVLTQHNERSSPEHPKPPNSRRLVFGESATRAEAV